MKALEIRPWLTNEGIVAYTIDGLAFITTVMLGTPTTKRIQAILYDALRNTLERARATD